MSGAPGTDDRDQPPVPDAVEPVPTDQLPDTLLGVPDSPPLPRR